MYSVIRRYHLDDGDIDETLHRVDTHLAETLADEPGFVAYECIQTDPDEVVSVSTFRDEEGCVRSNQLAAEFVRDELREMTISLAYSAIGEVAVSRAAREVLEPAHH